MDKKELDKKELDRILIDLCYWAKNNCNGGLVFLEDACAQIKKIKDKIKEAARKEDEQT